MTSIQGLELSAWAIAGLTGNQLSAYIISKTHNYNILLIVLLVLYSIAMIISLTIKSNCNK